MTRREFAFLPTLLLPASTVALPAIAAASMPDSLLIDRQLFQELLARNMRFVEKRVYSTGPRLFAFTSLEQRESAWRNAPSHGSADLQELAIYEIRHSVP